MTRARDLADLFNGTNNSVLAYNSSGALTEYTLGDWEVLTVDEDTGLISTQGAIGIYDNVVLLNSTGETINLPGTGSDGWTVVIDGAGSTTDDRYLCGRVSLSGDSGFENGASDYQWRVNNNGTMYASTGDTGLNFTGNPSATNGVGNATGELLSMRLSGYESYSSTPTKFFEWQGSYISAGGNIHWFSGAGLYAGTGLVDAMEIYFSVTGPNGTRNSFDDGFMRSFVRSS